MKDSYQKMYIIRLTNLEAKCYQHITVLPCSCILHLLVFTAGQENR